jgi:coenzyme F420-reducing hydrogenase delta subunit
LTGPKVVGIVCRWSGSDLDERIKASSVDGVRIIQTNCVANVTISMLSNIFTKGADVVFLLGCGKAHCKFYEGWDKIERTTRGLEVMLQDLGLEPERVILGSFKEDEDDPLKRMMDEALHRANGIGTSPYTTTQ